MAAASNVFNESDTDFQEKLELSLAYAGRIITEQEQWLVDNPKASSKLMKLFSGCQCYLEEPEPSILYSTLDPTCAPFVAKHYPSADSTVPAPVLTDASKKAVGAVPPIVPPTLVPAVPEAPTWVPPPMLPCELPCPLPAPVSSMAQSPALTQLPPMAPLQLMAPIPSMAPIPAMIQLPPMAPLPTYSTVYQPQYHQPLVSPPLYSTTPCQQTFAPTCQPAFAYPGQHLAPSPPLVTSPTMTRMSGYSSESSMSLPATPVGSPDPALGYPTFVPSHQAPVCTISIPPSCYPTPYVSYPSCPLYPQMLNNPSVGCTASVYPSCNNLYYGPPCYGPFAY